MGLFHTDWQPFDLLKVLEDMIVSHCNPKLAPKWGRYVPCCCKAVQEFSSSPKLPRAVLTTLHNSDAASIRKLGRRDRKWRFAEATILKGYAAKFCFRFLESPAWMLKYRHFMLPPSLKYLVVGIRIKKVSLCLWHI
jgi:hypothetical protein